MNTSEKKEQLPKNLQNKINEYIDKITNEQKQKLGEQTIEDQDIINFGKGGDEGRNSIVKKTKTTMDIIILMIMHYDIQRQAPNYRDDVFFKFKYDENNIKILQNIIEATTIYMDITDNEQKRIILINKYNQIIERIKRKFEGNITKNTKQTNKEIRNILANQQNSENDETIHENNETIHENNNSELFSKIYNKIRECAKHEFIKISEERQKENKELSRMPEIYFRRIGLLLKSTYNGPTEIINQLEKDEIGLDIIYRIADNENTCGNIVNIMEECENERIWAILINHNYELINLYRNRVKKIKEKYNKQEDKIIEILKQYEEIIYKHYYYIEGPTNEERIIYLKKYREKIESLIR